MQAKTRKNIRALFYPTPRVAIGWLIFFAACYGLFSVVRFITIKSRFFVVKNVQVTGHKYMDDKEIVKLADIRAEQTMFGVDLPGVTNTLLQNQYIHGVSVSRVLPSTILIDVQEREPFLYLIDRSIYMMDETGVLLKKLPRMPMGKLPIVTGLSVEALQQDSSAALSAIRLVKRIQEVDERLISLISEINLARDRAPELVLIKGAARVKIGREGIYQRLFILSEFLSKQPIIEQLPEIKQIDLTFADRIVVKKKT